MKILQKIQMKPIKQQAEAVPTNHKKDKYNHLLIKMHAI
jgi:hypothetical protein